MADAVSPKEAELRQEFEAWKATLKKCVGYGGGCAGDLVGLEHAGHCPMKGGQFATHWDAYKAGFEAGERKERERCASLIESLRGDGNYETAFRFAARRIRGGESTT